MKKIVKNVWIAGGSGARGRANTIYERLFWAAAQEETALLARYGTAATGLTPEQVERSREEHGSNVLTYGKRESVAKRLFSAFINPFTATLLALAVISAVTDIALASPGEKNCATVLIIATMVLLSGGLRFVQETRSGNVADKLLGMVVLGYMALVTVVKKRDIRRYGCSCGAATNFTRAGCLAPYKSEGRDCSRPSRVSFVWGLNLPQLLNQSSS